MCIIRTLYVNKLNTPPLDPLHSLSLKMKITKEGRHFLKEEKLHL